MTSDPNGRLFANDQRGQLYSISADGANVTEYLNIASFAGVDLQSASGEQGFQSFAFHPDFYQTGTAGFGKFYTIHSSGNTGPAPDFVSNPGGGDAFDTVLNEWSVSDPSRNLGNPFGAVLRIDPRGNDSANGQYGIVADNFFASDTSTLTIPEIYAYGFRNPQRFTWDTLTGEMYIADIGQGNIEEISQGENGGNFG